MSREELIKTGIEEFDEIIGGGIPKNSINIILGEPGTGKTVLSTEIAFNLAKSGERVLILSTLSEPSAKMLYYMKSFTFFDSSLFGDRVIYRDIGSFIAKEGIRDLLSNITKIIEEVNSSFLIIDSYKAISDLIKNGKEERLFTFRLSVALAVYGITSLLIGEYREDEFSLLPEFSIADGVIKLFTDRSLIQPQRFVQVFKMRGRNASMEAHPFIITNSGVLFIVKKRRKGRKIKERVLSSGFKELDIALGGGFEKGKNILIKGPAGAGKTLISLQTSLNIAKNGNKALFVSFEESEGELKSVLSSFGIEYSDVIDEGKLKILYYSLSELNTYTHLKYIIDEIENFQPDFFVLDFLEAFLYKINSESLIRDFIFYISSGLKLIDSSGVFILDSSREESMKTGFSESIFDGIINLSQEMSGLRRRRFFEIYKMRGKNHLRGKYRFNITDKGVEFLILPAHSEWKGSMGSIKFSPLEEILDKMPIYESAFLIRGLHGVGKTILSLLFAMDGLKNKEKVLFVSLDTRGEILEKYAKGFGFNLDPLIKEGRLVIVDPYTEKKLGSIFDLDEYIFYLVRLADKMGKPLRIIMDSLTPLAILEDKTKFVEFIHKKNMFLKGEGVSILDVKLDNILDKATSFQVASAYDIVLDLVKPDWGEAVREGMDGSIIRIRKSRGVKIERNAFPFVIVPGEGIKVIKGMF